jgi:hypothetical protein
LEEKANSFNKHKKGCSFNKMGNEGTLKTDKKSIGNGNEKIIIESLLMVFSLGDHEIKKL